MDQKTGVTRRGDAGARRRRTGMALLRGGGPGGGGLVMLLVEVDHLWGEPMAQVD